MRKTKPMPMPMPMPSCFNFLDAPGNPASLFWPVASSFYLKFQSEPKPHTMCAMCLNRWRYGLKHCHKPILSCGRSGVGNKVGLGCQNKDIPPWSYPDAAAAGPAAATSAAASAICIHYVVIGGRETQV